jgi:hypothetical protein
MHLSSIELGTKKESTTLSLKMRYTLIKCPEELPGLLYGIKPVNSFREKFIEILALVE